MPSVSLQAKANTGAGTDPLAGVTTPQGFAGAVMLVDAAGADHGAGNPLRTSEGSAASILAAIQDLLAATAIEDTPSPGGERGMVVLAQRRDTDSAATSADGDYATLKMDEAGRLKTASQPAKYALVTGSITANGQTVFCQCDRGSNIIAHMVATALVGHNVTFEGSIDSTNGTDGAWFAIDAKRTNANTVELVTGVLATTPAYAWELSVNGFNFIRVRATTHTSGTALWKFQQAPYATEPIPVAQVTGTQPVSLASLPALATGANAVGDVGIQYRANATGAAAPVKVISAATSNPNLVKATAGRVVGYDLINNATAVRYLKFFNKATAPVPGTDVPTVIVPLPPNGGKAQISHPGGIGFATGIGYSIVAGSADLDATAIASGDVVGTIFFA